MMSTPTFEEFIASSASVPSSETEMITGGLTRYSSHQGFVFSVPTDAVEIEPLGSGAYTAYLDEKLPWRSKSREFGNVSVTSARYPRLMSQVIEIQGRTNQALSSLHDRMDKLAGVVTRLLEVREQELEDKEFFDGPDTLDFDTADLTTVLNRASDTGFFDDYLMEIAESQLQSDNQFARLAAMRSITLTDPERGKALITESLESETNPSIRNALKATLKAVG